MAIYSKTLSERAIILCPWDPVFVYGKEDLDSVGPFKLRLGVKGVCQWAETQNSATDEF